MAEVPVDVSEMHPVQVPSLGTAHGSAKLWLCSHALVNFGLDTFSEASWAQLSFFPP